MKDNKKYFGFAETLSYWDQIALIEKDSIDKDKLLWGKLKSPEKEIEGTKQVSSQDRTEI